jgi:hypothetical protein
MKGAPIPYSPEELQWVSDNRTLVISECHAKFCYRFNRTDVSAVNLHSLRKRNGWRTGRTGCFEKGNIPHPDARPKGPNSTSFKKGQRPLNWKPVGSQRVSVDGYLEIKTAEPRTWRQVHVVNWEALSGPVPDDMCVVFIDGNKLNTGLANLELITRNELLQINRLRCSSLPDQVRPVVRTMGKLIARTHEASN